MSDIDLLAQTIRQQIIPGQMRSDYGWHNPALNVLDCVLKSLVSWTYGI